jgi:hypothetical protein
MQEQRQGSKRSARSVGCRLLATITSSSPVTSACFASSARGFEREGRASEANDQLLEGQVDPQMMLRTANSSKGVTVARSLQVVLHKVKAKEHLGTS